MKSAKLIIGLFLLIFISCKSNDDNQPIINTNLVLVNTFPDLNFNQPLDIQNPGDGSERLFIVEKAGTIKVVNTNSPEQSTTFLSISNNVYNGNEMGLLGLAFHPNYVSNGYFYVNYNPNSALTRISRFQVSSSNPNSANVASELIFLEFFQNATNHNGGQLAFGPDGFLYISSGDGGGGVNGNSQNLSTLTGNILRIDVDNLEGILNYSIPSTNPFINDSDARDEIYAYGFRNPWRMSFDSATGKLWVADVGNGQREEIDIVENGGNYGWNIFEGTNCFSGPCDTPGLTAPVYEYSHGNSDGSITGGYVYRGSINNELTGKYIYGDYLSGRIWTLDINTFENTLLFDTDLNITTFGLDANNELYVSDISSGAIYKLIQQEE